MVSTITPSGAKWISSIRSLDPRLRPWGVSLRLPPLSDPSGGVASRAEGRGSVWRRPGVGIKMKGIGPQVLAARFPHFPGPPILDRPYDPRGGVSHVPPEWGGAGWGGVWGGVGRDGKTKFHQDR